MVSGIRFITCWTRNPESGTKEEQEARGRDMDFSGRLSAIEYRNLAARWRALAADATTPKTRNHLLSLARQCEFLAGGDAGLERTDGEAPGFFGAPK